MRASNFVLLHGLGEEVVGAGVERRDHVTRRGVRGDDHHRQRRGQRIGAQLAADLVAVHARQVEVEQHQLRRVLDDRAHAGLAVSQADHPVALALEDACKQDALRRLVFDDQHEAALPGLAADGPSFASGMSPRRAHVTTPCCAPIE